MNRRDFLKTSAAVSLAMGAMAQPKRIRCGLLGIDHAHALDLLDVLSKSPDYEVAGICEPDATVRKKFEGEKALAGVRWLSEDELLGDPAVQMIAVESGVPRLLPLARQVVDAGKHLHLDKPAGTSLEAFKAILDTAEQKGRLVQMGYMFRYNPGFDLVRQAVKEGWLGEVYSIDASMCTMLTPEKRKRASHHPGGMMLELGCHLIDIVVLLLGKPDKVTSVLRHDGGGDDTLADNTVAIFEYPHAMVTVESAAMEQEAFEARRFKVAGKQGTIILEPLEPPRARLCLSKPAGGFKKGWQTIPLPDIPRHVRDVEDLARAIRKEAVFAYSKDHDYTVQEAILRACNV